MSPCKALGRMRSPRPFLQGLLGGCEKNLDVDVFRHTIDEPMRLEQARAAGEDEMDTSVVTRQLAFSRVEVAEQA